MRSIDADELLKRVDEERQYLLARGQEGAEHILVNNFRVLIDKAPTIERPQGHWELTDNSGAVCSSCHRLNRSHGYFCKFCGSDNRDMRGEENE